MKKCALAFLMYGVLFVTVRAQAGEIKGTVTAQGMRSAENVAVYIDAIPGKTFAPPSQHAEMDQKQLKFTPHVLVVLKGTTVDFLTATMSATTSSGRRSAETRS